MKWWLCSAVICIASIALFHFVGDAEIGVHNLVGGGKHGKCDAVGETVSEQVNK